uniref:Enoyl reductase (ER) domain-containing protein n=1 Tax=Mucochytrium quahogii TaxID=96639 RepID=A0A7S2S7N2_9STRA
MCASVNFPDALMIQGKYQFQPPMPLIPGGEMSGVVEKVGPGVERVKIGDRVFGSTMIGSFSEKIVIDQLNLLPMGNKMDFKVASCFMMTYGTTMHAFRQRAKLQPGETVLVLGASGGVGLAAVELAKAMGATVIAAASTDKKLDICKSCGADFLINYSKQDIRKQVKEFTDGKGVDVVYDPVGDKYAEPAVRSLAWNGRYLVIGFAAGEIPKIPLNLCLLKGASIVGVFYGAFIAKEPSAYMQNTKMLVEMISNGKLKPLIGQTYSLSQTPQALRDMMDRKVTGKAVILCSEESRL